MDDVLKKYPNDVKVVIKNFPLSFHKQARRAAQYSLAAAKQGKYKEMYHAIMENYKLLKSNEDYPVKIAEELGLDIEQFKKEYGDLMDPDHSPLNIKEMDYGECVNRWYMENAYKGLPKRRHPWLDAYRTLPEKG